MNMSRTITQAVARRFAPEEGGFTLIELLVVVGILGLVGAIAVLNIGVFVGSGFEEAYLAEQHNVQTAVIAYLGDGNSIASEFTVCPGSKGPLSPYLTGDLAHCWLIGLGAAVSPVDSGPVSSPLGDGFQEISDSMIQLALEYYEEYGRWPRSWGDFRFTDLGLDPGDWDDVNVEGVIYSPTGNRLQVEPAEGYVFLFEYADGSGGTLTSSLNWNLVYSYETEDWYFRSVDDGNQIDISTLQIVAE